MNVIEAADSLYKKIKHLDCVKGCTLQDEKTIVVVLKHHDQDALHEIPMFYEGFKVYHKVQSDTPKPKPKTEKKPEPKKGDKSGNLSSGTFASVLGKIRDIGNSKNQW